MSEPRSRKSFEAWMDGTLPGWREAPDSVVIIERRKGWDAAQADLTKSIEDAVRTILVNRNVDVDAAVQFAQDCIRGRLRGAK